jgi:regulator of cell morphogenesis and NO signaling
MEKTVREIAVECPASVRVFETLGIDYCCGGKKSLRDACTSAQVPLERVMELLSNAANTLAGPDDAVWSTAPLDNLTTHIVQKHHRYVRQEIPRLDLMLAKVADKHGAAHAELSEIKRLFAAIAQELSTHLLKEEQVLFPHIDRMAIALRQESPLPPAFFGTVEHPIANMLADHDDAGEVLARMRELSNGYAPPEGACPTYRALYQGLAEFEQDLHRHIHLENNILFPRAIEMERSGR